MGHATTAEILKAYVELTPAELLLLRRIGAKLVGGTSFSEPMDLLHEAMDRSLDGRRNWPGNVPFAVFLGNAMRSIAHGERGLAQNKPGARVDFDDYEAAVDETRGADGPEEQLIVFEEIRMRRKSADDARIALDGDEPAQKVLSGMLAGMSPREMCASFHMDSKAFDAARHRVMRRLKHSKELH